jgi:GH24 family phage-related lysozyme (muramidase)
MRETGVGLYEPLFFIGVVENNVDERLEKRVQVRAFGVHGTVDQVPTESLPWATLIYGSYDPNSPLPPINSFVFGFFVDGRDAQQPMILGLIPTQLTEVINPSVTGWGAVPGRDSSIIAKGSTPDDYGQPSNSRLERGENLDQTYVLLQELNRVKDVPTAKMNSDDTTPAFEEPAPAYNAQYPYNRVIETASHSIELDDTPGAERITIFHRSGSYVSIDSNGTSVHKSISDKYEVNDTHQHVYVGGKSQVTIMGDSRVLVKGNKVEEVEGDFMQIVHGNHLLSVAGQMNLNGSEEVQMRAAKLRFEANVENINFKSSRAINIESGKSISVKSGEAIAIQSTDRLDIKSGTNLFLNAQDIGHLRAQTVRIGGSRVDINASNVYIDDNISMANGSAVSPSVATTAVTAEGTELPEPASKSASTTQYRNSSSLGSAGYASQDEGGGGSSSSASGADPAVEYTGSANASMDLLTLVKSFEGFSEYPYEDYGQWSIGYGSGVGPSSQPPKIPGPISEQEATRLLSENLQKFIVNVETINQKGNYNWTQESKDALTCFAYNIGSINELTANGTRDNATIAAKMLEYSKAGGVTLSALVQRRTIERQKFLNGLAGTSSGALV